MRYFILSVIISSFLLTACQEDANEYPIPPDTQGRVSFKIGSLDTRGAPLMQLSEVDSFQVVAYRHSGLWNEVNSSSLATVFMNHISVVQSADNTWVYSPLQYWPINENVTFFGYSPAASTSDTPNSSGLSVSTPTNGQAPVITYEVPAKVEDQPDLLLVTSPNYNLNGTTNGNTAVNMQLSHALTCVAFKATGQGEAITKVKISGIVGKGSIALGQPSVVWNINPTDTTYTFEAGTNQEPLDQVTSSILSADGYLMMLPQTLTDNAKLTITVEAGDVSKEQTFSLNVPGKEEWRAGEIVEYQLAVASTGAIILSPESLVLASSEKSYSSFTIICPDQNPDAAWVVSSPDNGWMQISDSQSGVNQAPQLTSYTYAGNGTTRLFAFAPQANTSAVHLTSTIVLEGTSQQIDVIQLYQDEIYVPKFPHDGWAGSNVYWVADNNFPGGGYLTFDDKGETTHEEYQGVYFMWGSLVALSPVGNTWTGGVWNNGSGQIIYIPNPDSFSNGGWSPAINTGWGYIPRLGWTNPSNPNGGGSSVNIPFNNTQSYLIQNHSSTKNVGDICKYITDMGWAPGAKEGRKWRMPTHVEYESMGDYAKVGVPFGYQASNNPFGQMPYKKGFRRLREDGTPFFPNSGYRINYFFVPNGGIETDQNYRPGEAFSYWTSSPRTLNGDAFDYIGINQEPTNVQGFRRDSGGTVRCVLESNN